jgi:translation initiation factor IF-3
MPDVKVKIRVLVDGREVARKNVKDTVTNRAQAKGLANEALAAMSKIADDLVGRL